MREETWTITASDGAKIFGVTNTPNVDHGRHVVMVHGLTGHPYEYALKRVADALCEKGYTVHRPALYWAEEGCRQLHETSLKVHASDVNDVVSNQCGENDKIFVIGHSYGAPSVMIANPKNTVAASLWDPSFALDKMWNCCGDDLAYTGDQPYLKWGVGSLISNEYIEEGKSFIEEKCLQLSEQAKFPIQVIHAEFGLYIKDDKSYHSVGHKKNRQEIVKGTQHCFYEGNTCDDLIEKTINWFEEF